MALEDIGASLGLDFGPTVFYDGAARVLKDAQKHAAGRVVANDPRGRPLRELAPLSLRTAGTV